MLSEDLRNLARQLEIGVSAKQVTIGTVCNVIEALDAFADAARQLESTTIHPAACIPDGDLPERVIRIATVLARKGVGVGRAGGAS